MYPTPPRALSSYEVELHQMASLILTASRRTAPRLLQKRLFATSLTPRTAIMSIATLDVCLPYHIPHPGSRTNLCRLRLYIAFRPPPPPCSKPRRRRTSPLRLLPKNSAAKKSPLLLSSTAKPEPLPRISRSSLQSLASNRVLSSSNCKVSPTEVVPSICRQRSL